MIFTVYHQIHDVVVVPTLPCDVHIGDIAWGGVQGSNTTGSTGLHPLVSVCKVAAGFGEVTVCEWIILVITLTLLPMNLFKAGYKSHAWGSHLNISGVCLIFDLGFILHLQHVLIFVCHLVWRWEHVILLNYLLLIFLHLDHELTMVVSLLDDLLGKQTWF